MIKLENLKLVNEWDKTFKKSKKVKHKKIIFNNRYGITLAADMYIPIERKEKYPGVVVLGPFGAVKEQSSGLYAQELSEKGYVTLAVDPSFTGESGGNVRDVASPDINTEDFSAAIDYLTTIDYIDKDKIGIIGICGFGGMALNAAIIDTRIKATVTITMYDMTRVSAKGYYDKMTIYEKYENLKNLNLIRTKDYLNKKYSKNGGLPESIKEDMPKFIKDYYNYYKTNRGYHKRSLNSNSGWNSTSVLSFINMPILQYSEEIKSACLLIHGENAHSLYFSNDIYKRLIGDNKKIYIVKGANHIDLYDNKKIIPFKIITDFFKEYLK